MEFEENKKRSGWNLTTPVFLAVLAGIFTIVGAYVQGYNNIQLAARNLESSVILKAIETDDQQKACDNILYFHDIQLVQLSPTQVAFLQTCPESAPLLSAPIPVVRSTRTISEVILLESQNANDSIPALLSHLQTLPFASVHYIINRKGDMEQMIDDEDVAYHSGLQHNLVSISIELLHDTAKEPYPEEQLQRLTVLLAELVSRHNIPTSHILAQSQIDARRSTDIEAQLDGIRAKVELMLSGTVPQH
jgi:hypothetical protein